MTFAMSFGNSVRSAGLWLCLLALLPQLSFASDKSPEPSDKDGMVTITLGEYEALKHDAAIYRANHDRKGLGQVIWQVKLFGLDFNFTWWKIIGGVAALLFAGRWLVQMYYSRKFGRPVIPRLYWVISITASIMLLAYWILSPQRAMVGVLQNLFPVFVATYNLYLDIRYHRDNGRSSMHAPTHEEEKRNEKKSQEMVSAK